jgi:DNA repair exonuclease SbcCD ATPase subunit
MASGGGGGGPQTRFLREGAAYSQVQTLSREGVRLKNELQQGKPPAEVLLAWDALQSTVLQATAFAEALAVDDKTRDARASHLATGWIHDEHVRQCQLCEKPFGAPAAAASRLKQYAKSARPRDLKQHCRACGFVVCNTCCPEGQELPLTDWVHAKPPYVIKRDQPPKMKGVCECCNRHQPHDESRLAIAAEEQQRARDHQAAMDHQAEMQRQQMEDELRLQQAQQQRHQAAMDQQKQLADSAADQAARERRAAMQDEEELRRAQQQCADEAARQQKQLAESAADQAARERRAAMQHEEELRRAQQQRADEAARQDRAALQRQQELKVEQQQRAAEAAQQQQRRADEAERQHRAALQRQQELKAKARDAIAELSDLAFGLDCEEGMPPQATARPAGNARAPG